MQNSTLFVAVSDTVTGPVQSAGDFTNNTATLTNLDIRGRRGSDTPALINSNIAAPNILNVTLASIQTDNGATVFGLTAFQFNRLLRRDSATTIVPPAPGFTQDEDFIIRLL